MLHESYYTAKDISKDILKDTTYDNTTAPKLSTVVLQFRRISAKDAQNFS